MLSGPKIVIHWQEQRLANDLPPKYEDIIISQAEEGKVTHHIINLRTIKIVRSSAEIGSIFCRYQIPVTQQ